MANNLLGARAKLVNIRAGIKQRGVTLMELIAGLAVMAVIVVGALALFNTANNAQRGMQLTQDVTALRGAVTHLWMGQGGYGNVSLVPALIAAGRVPGTLRATATGPLQHQTGVIDILGAGQRYHVVVTGLSQAVCIDLLTGASGWIEVRTATAYTGIPLATTAISAFPINPADAMTRCVTGNSNVVQFTGS